ncbi:tyrosine-type recombinase/integrase [Natrinema limicola]|uniref:Site-specific recombinase xerd n=1 Tax=Natrinema limicola JCM 13563 TaxID=1230457 RepID=M0CU34_9EURY|nr:site-specific integrase [Natrinema limicola]ELZ25912.1 site-specific recombinase xerd [Natrinema limicola JCM 13563]
MVEAHKIEGIPLVPEPSRNWLNRRQLIDYRHLREELLNWMLHLGKDPEQAKGYAHETVRRRAYDLDRFYRWVWETDQTYTSHVTHDHADQYCRELAYSDESATYKTNIQKALKMLFRWRQSEFNDDLWEPELTFSDTSSASQPKDFLSREERRQIREAALEYGSVPNYNSLSPEQRRKWKRYLAHSLRKPMSEIAADDFKRANGFKVPSLVWTALDTGLRPIEVERAKISWVDTENAVLRIPAEEAAKNNEHWIVSLQQRTAEMLYRWLDERELYSQYGETDSLWLTREGNPYRSHSLKYLLNRLCEIAGIPTENRQISWYVIRHSVGTYMTREEGLAAAQIQLRHRSERTTMKYDQAPVEDRRAALERMG